MEGAKSLPESEVVHLWLQQMQRCRRLADSRGSPVEVIYPGRWNDQRGGDFRDAVVAAGGISQQGCIEVHTRSSGWVAHGHHRDPVYNQVILHVAFQEDRPDIIQRQDGRGIPTIILERQMAPERRYPPDAKVGGLPCLGIGRRWKTPYLADLLENAGAQRFEVKVGRYLEELKLMEPEQCLYRGVLEALGYTKNQVPFGKLAAAAPLSAVETIFLNESGPESSGRLAIQAFLLGTAGLLPSQRNRPMEFDESAAGLERRWSEFGKTAAMTDGEWELFKVRPGNYPVRRIIALSYLVPRLQEPGWEQSFSTLIQTVPVNQAARACENLLMVPAEAYWSGRFDFRPPGSSHDLFLIGRERAAAITLNVILPVLAARARRLDDTDLSIKVREISRQYPRQGSNSIEKHMRQQLGLESDVIRSACSQQGLLHLYKNFCIQGRCGECELVGV